MITRNLRFSPILATLLTLVFPYTASAEDFDGFPLGDLIAGSDHVVIGIVTKVVPGPTPGLQLAEIGVKEDLLATSPPKTISLEGDALNPASPSFVPESTVLALLRELPSPQPEEPQFEPVAESQGIIEVPDGTLDVTRAIMQKAITLGPALGLHDVSQELKHQAPEPSAQLVRTLLDDLRIDLSVTDAPLLTEVACDLADEFINDVQIWGIYRIGNLDISEARLCLEDFVGSATTSRERLAASEALGELGDARSVPVLLSVLEAPRKKDKKDDVGFAQGTDNGLNLSVILALGKIGDPKATKTLRELAFESEDLALHSTIVHALGLIGTPRSASVLRKISRKHPNELIRDQARRILERMASTGISS